MIRTIKPFNNTRIFINTQKRFKSYEPFRNDWLNNSLDKSKIACIVNKDEFIHSNDEMFNKFISKVKFCEWKDLKSTIFYDEKILISNFGDEHPYSCPPIFINAKHVFIDKSYHWFHDYWIHKKIFPSVKTLFINGCINFHISKKFEIYITPQHYTEAKHKNDHIKGITLEDYNQLIYDNEIVEPKTEKYIAIDTDKENITLENCNFNYGNYHKNKVNW